MFEELVRYVNSPHRSEAYEVIKRDCLDSDGEINRNIEVITKYIFDLERRLSEIGYMKQCNKIRVIRDEME